MASRHVGGVQARFQHRQPPRREQRGLMKRARYTQVISIRLTSDELELLCEATALVPLVPRLTLARFAMLLGLGQIKNNPRVVAHVNTFQKPRRKRSQ